MIHFSIKIPNGVYCKDRLRRKAWPALPTSFSFVSHIVAEDDLTGKTGVLVPWRVMKIF